MRSFFKKIEEMTRQFSPEVEAWAERLFSEAILNLSRINEVRKEDARNIGRMFNASEIHGEPLILNKELMDIPASLDLIDKGVEGMLEKLKITNPWLYEFIMDEIAENYYMDKQRYQEALRDIGMVLMLLALGEKPEDKK